MSPNWLIRGPQNISIGTEKEMVNGSWRFKGNSVDQGERWIGSTTFHVVADVHETVVGKEASEPNSENGITICMQAWGLSIISQDNMFAPQSVQYMANETPVGRRPVLHLILQRQSALCEPPCAEFVAGAALCEPRRGSSAERRLRDGLVSYGRNRPSIVIRVFTCFLKCRFPGRHSAL